jgi:hypothetical protein
VAGLRAGEVVAGVGGLLLLCSPGGRRRPLGLLPVSAGASGVALAYFQATRRAPALPVALSVVVTVLGGASTIALLARIRGVLGAHGRRGAAIWLVGALLTALGGFASMRQEGGTDPAALGELETITL